MSFDKGNELHIPWNQYQPRLIRRDAQNIPPESREELMARIQVKALETGKEPDPKIMNILQKSWRKGGGNA